MPELTRRNVLLSTAAIGAAGLAGCVSDSEDGESANAGASNGDENGSENGNESTAGNETETGDDGTDGADSGEESGSTGSGSDPSNITLETVGAACAEGDNDSVTIDWSGGVIVVNGTTPAPNPCHEAVLKEGTIEDGSFTLVVDVADANEGGVCQDCVGAVEYEARVEPENPDEITEATVRHIQGGSHGVAVESASDEGGEPTSGEPSIETQDAGCLSGERERNVVVSRTESGISIEGAMQTPNPCHKAVLGGVTVENGQLTVDVSAESTLSEDEACTQCVGEVLYTVDVPLSNADSLSRVTVTHPDDEQITVDADDIEPAE